MACIMSGVRPKEPTWPQSAQKNNIFNKYKYRNIQQRVPRIVQINSLHGIELIFIKIGTPSIDYKFGMILRIQSRFLEFFLKCIFSHPIGEAEITATKVERPDKSGAPGSFLDFPSVQCSCHRLPLCRVANENRECQCECQKWAGNTYGTPYRIIWHHNYPAGVTHNLAVGRVGATMKNHLQFCLSICENYKKYAYVEYFGKIICKRPPLDSPTLPALSDDVATPSAAPPAPLFLHHHHYHHHHHRLWCVGLGTGDSWAPKKRCQLFMQLFE